MTWRHRQTSWWCHCWKVGNAGVLRRLPRGYRMGSMRDLVGLMIDDDGISEYHMKKESPEPSDGRSCIPPARFAMPGMKKYLYRSLMLLPTRRLVVDA